MAGRPAMTLYIRSSPGAVPRLLGRRLKGS